MTEQEAIDSASKALDLWQRANNVIRDSKFTTDIDRRERSRRLMDLDRALFDLDRFASSQATSLSMKAHIAMKGAA